jgi:uncharacterized repeat protein (TIGR01451 family)
MRRLLCALLLALLVPLPAIAGSAPPAAADGHEAPGAPLAARSLSAGNSHTCAALTGGRLKCWGGSGSGQLGQGSSTARGDGSNEMGANLAAIELGAGRRAVSVGAGANVSCAVLDDGRLKCWGQNSSGELGLGDTAARGDAPGEMGDALPAVDLGAGRTATAVSVGGAAVCATLDNGTVKCWGQNNGGGLGQGDTATRGDGPGEMGNNLNAIDLGAGRTVVAVAAGGHSCAVLDDGTLKCWGFGGTGRLGYGDSTSRGDNANEMGANLPAVALGTGRTATAVTTGNSHTCALLDDGAVKCWGSGGNGQLGNGSVTNLGDGANEMGDNLQPVNLGAGRTATAISAAGNHTCALLDDGSVKCWGVGASGELGNGTAATIGDGPNEMGDNLLPIDLGSGRTAVAITSGATHSCAVLDDTTIRCWGENASGQLGLGDTADRGEAPGEMGASLPTVDLGGTFATGPGLAIDVEAADTEYVVGETIDYVVTVTNTGGAPLTGVEIVDTDVPGCDVSVGALGVGTEHQQECSHTAVAADIGTFTHEASANSDQTTPVAGSSQVTVLTNAGASIEVQADDTSYVVGEEIDYTVTVTNTGGVPLTGVTITDTDVAGCATVVGSLAVGAADETECSHTAVGADIGTFSHTATVDSDQTEPIASAASEVTVVAGPALEISVVSNEETVLAGEDVHYTVTVTNAGGVPLTGVTVSDTDFPDCAGAPGSLQPGTGHAFLCTYTTVVGDVGTLSHTATADSDQTDPVASQPWLVSVARVRPDARIRLGGGAVAGNNVYNVSGANQSRSATVANRGIARFTLTAQNDGTAQENLRVTGLGSSNRYLVTYRAGGENVTADVAGDGFVFGDVDPGELRTVAVTVQARARIPAGAAITRRITVASGLTELRDVVKLTVTRRR